MRSSLDFIPKMKKIDLSALKESFFFMDLKVWQAKNKNKIKYQTFVEFKQNGQNRLIFLEIKIKRGGS